MIIQIYCSRLLNIGMLSYDPTLFRMCLYLCWKHVELPAHLIATQFLHADRARSVTAEDLVYTSRPSAQEAPHGPLRAL